MRQARLRYRNNITTNAADGYSVIHAMRRNGQTCDFIVDTEALPTIGQYHWSMIDIGLRKTYRYGRAYSHTDSQTGKQRNVYLHQMVWTHYSGAPSLVDGGGKRLVIDHIDGNTLDCRIANLRLVSHKINGINQQSKIGIYRGTSKFKDSDKWKAIYSYIGEDGKPKTKFLGAYDNRIQAALIASCYRIAQKEGIVIARELELIRELCAMDVIRRTRGRVRLEAAA